MAIIYIAHRYSSDPPNHRADVARIARVLVLEGHLPLAPQIYLPQFLAENTERDLALRCCLRLLALADEVWVFGEPTEGMRHEIAQEERLNIPVIECSNNMNE